MKITLIESAKKSEVFVNKTHVTIGRSSQCDVPVATDGLSRQHCAIEFVDDIFSITDLGSTNGVFLDGVRLEANVKTTFSSFNVLNIGPIELHVEDTHNDGVKASPLTISSRLTDQNQKDNYVSYNPSTKKRKLKNSIFSNFSFLVLVIFFGLIFYFRKPMVESMPLMSNPIHNPSTAMSLFVHQATAEKVISPDAFKPPSDYIDQNRLKTCKGLIELCTKMNVHEKNEGFFVEGREISLYLAPRKILEDSRYGFHSSVANFDELIAMERVIPSELLDLFYQGQFDQIHVILNDEREVPYKVYRFHRDHTIRKSFNRIYSLKLLLPVLRGGKDPMIFWNYLKKSILSLDLPK